MQTPESAPSSERRLRREPARAAPESYRTEGFWGLGQRLALISGLVLAVSSFTGWYAGSGEGIDLAVIGWHTGAIGKVLFFLGLAVLALAALREAGIELPAMVPESLVVIFLGSLATVLVLIKIISIPEEFLPADGRGIGIWISLAAALAVVVAGLLEAGEEL